jgi:hypothetical protein
MEDKRLKRNGLSPINDLFDAHMRGCNEAIKENPELVILYDLESGFPYVATKEERDAFDAIWEACKPKPMNNKNIGKIICFGTGGQVDKYDSDFDYGFSDLE